MERYPDNGKLLKIYGRFLEFVKNDPWTASKYYAEAVKLGISDSLAALQHADGAAGKSVLGAIDEKVDAIIIINAEGTIMTVNAAGCAIFGYAKGELEGKNISCLMPQPFSQRHTGYINQYVATGMPHILDTRREVVGLTRQQTVFPVNLAVTKISGTRQDSIFMGLLRPVQNEGNTVVKVYATVAGVVLCAEEPFSDMFGIASQDVVGKPFTFLGCNSQEMGLCVLLPLLPQRL
eukprot:jgi/Chrzof1/12271/Cz06g28060.t1